MRECERTIRHCLSVRHVRMRARTVTSTLTEVMMVSSLISKDDASAIITAVDKIAYDLCRDMRASWLSIVIFLGVPSIRKKLELRNYAHMYKHGDIFGCTKHEPRGDKPVQLAHEDAVWRVDDIAQRRARERGGGHEKRRAAGGKHVSACTSPGAPDTVQRKPERNCGELRKAEKERRER